MIEALGRKTYVYLANHQVITCSYPLKKWIEQLSDKGFTQTHKAFLVNLTHILNIQKDNDILLTDHKKAPLSRHFKQSFYDAYYQHVRTSL
ncbi:LytR/AlgR family response regulator transcription factor [Amedibacillus dolichus]|uniref:LytR/AlgR family response regulator transcription factor n=1 Tax=Amedibacillus dolichus TaxID=31971 RepID=UPI00241BFFE7|nr:LytTR family DNA-binding domain-containing protein [Amedibacillus dolichus]